MAKSSRGRSSRSECRVDGTSRAQTALVGVVLLVGLVAVGSVGLLLVGQGAIDESRDRAVDAQAGAAFVELGAEVDSVARSESGANAVDLSVPSSSGAIVRSDTSGQVTVTHRNRSGVRTVMIKDLGTITYEHDGTDYAYQAGGVWRGRGRAATMLSAPSFQYTADSDGSNPTLTLVLTDLTGTKRMTGGRAELRKQRTTTPLKRVSAVDGVVTVEIESPYYAGWGEYFESRYQELIVEYDHPARTVSVTVGRKQIDGGWGQAVHARTGAVTTGGGNSGYDGPVYAPDGVDCGTGSCTVVPEPDGAYADLDPVIAKKVSTARTDPTYATAVDVDDGTTLSGAPGGVTYFDDDGFALGSGETTTVDLAAGNVTLVVDGNLNLTKSEFTVENGDGTGETAFRVYATGNLSMKNARFCGDTDCTTSGFGAKKTAEDLQVYGTSTMTVGMRGGSTKLEGAIYAPRETEVPGPNEAFPGTNAYKCDDADGDTHHADVCIVNGDTAIYGAVVAGPTRLSQSTTLRYDGDLGTVSPVLMPTGVIPPPLTYLHVSVDEVELR